MHPRVFVVLAASDGAAVLPATLEAIASQTSRPYRLIAVDGGSRDETRQLLERSSADVVIDARREPYGALIGRGARHVLDGAPDDEPLPAVAGGEEADHDWLWLLAHDAVPHPRALEALLAHVDANPSVAVVGPKVMRADEPDRFAEFGQTMTAFGRSILLREGELDQGQHDDASDVMSVAESGMLVRRDVFDALGGFDPALRSMDAGLDLGVRARLAGHRVALEPAARVRRAGGPEHFQAKSVSDASRVGIARKAALHRRLSYANPFAAVLHWLLLVPLAIVRSIGHVLAKRPASIVSEWNATAWAMFGIAQVKRARRRIRTTRTARWHDLEPLRIRWRQVRMMRRTLGDPRRKQVTVDERVGFVEGAGLWVTAFAAIVGVVLLPQLIGAGAALGGATLPLSESVGSVFRHSLAGYRDELATISGAADPFTLVLAFVGSLTPWQPSVAIVILLFIAPALASVTAFFAVRSLVRSKWVPAVAALVWAIAPTLLVAITEARLGAIVAHIALPLAIAGGLSAYRSWRAAGAAALLIALVAASAPVLLPALALLVVIGALAHPREALRPLVATFPTIALMLPLVLDRWRAGIPLASLADPGVPTSAAAPTPIELALLAPEGTMAGLESLVGALTGGDQTAWVGTPGVAAAWVALVLIAALALTALAGIALRPVRSIPFFVLSLAGYASAAAATRLSLTTIDTEPVQVWAGSSLSLALASLVALAALALDADERRSVVPGGLIAVGAVLAAVPVVVTSFLAPATVIAAPERRMPAFVAAAAEADPNFGVLVLRPLADDTLTVDVERGAGRTLDEISTARLVRSEATEAETQLAQVAVDLVSAGDVGDPGVLDDQGIGFILLEPGRQGAAGLHDRAERSLDARGELQAVGQTEAGLLWQRPDSPSIAAPEPQAGAVWLFVAQLAALAAAAVAALPSVRRGERVRTRRSTTTGEWQ